MKAISTNNADFVNFSSRDFGFSGDRGTWVKYDEYTRTITVNIAAKGTISSKYLSELEEFAAEHGFSQEFTAMRCGERRTITLPSPHVAEETRDKTFVFEDNSYTLTEQAEPTSSYFHNCFQDAEEGKSYTASWAATAVNADGEKFSILWHFTQIKGQEDSPEDLPWDNEHIEDVTPL